MSGIKWCLLTRNIWYQLGPPLKDGLAKVTVAAHYLTKCYCLSRGARLLTLTVTASSATFDSNPKSAAEACHAMSTAPEDHLQCQKQWTSCKILRDATLWHVTTYTTKHTLSMGCTSVVCVACWFDICWQGFHLSREARCANDTMRWISLRKQSLTVHCTLVPVFCQYTFARQYPQWCPYRPLLSLQLWTSNSRWCRMHLAHCAGACKMSYLLGWKGG